MKSKRVALVLIRVMAVLVLFTILPWLLVQQHVLQGQAADTVAAAPASAPLHFNVASTTIGNTELIPAKEGVRFRIVSLTISGQSTTATNIYLHSGGRALWCDSANPQPIDMMAVSGISGIDTSEHLLGWIETEYENQSLQVNSSAAQKVNFRGTYYEIR